VTVAAAYRHETKRVTPGPPLQLGPTVLKWYELASPGEPVPASVRVLARCAVLEAARPLEDELGFVILHRCGDDFYFLLVCTWRNDNEVWETVWAKAGERDVTFRPWTVEGRHRPTFCVWELGPVWHEQQAWSRFLRSPRDGTARAAYLGDLYAGDV
jgi:hypothetical protein